MVCVPLAVSNPILSSFVLVPFLVPFRYLSFPLLLPLLVLLLVPLLCLSPVVRVTRVPSCVPSIAFSGFCPKRRGEGWVATQEREGTGAL